MMLEKGALKKSDAFTGIDVHEHARLNQKISRTSSLSQYPRIRRR